MQVAIPSNRVNVSYGIYGKGYKPQDMTVAIPSNRVNVSYFLKFKSSESISKSMSQSPQIGSMFPTFWLFGFLVYLWID